MVKVTEVLVLLWSAAMLSSGADRAISRTNCPLIFMLLLLQSWSHVFVLLFAREVLGLRHSYEILIVAVDAVGEYC